LPSPTTPSTQDSHEKLNFYLFFFHNFIIYAGSDKPMVWKQYACNLSKSIRFKQVFLHLECKDI